MTRHHSQFNKATGQFTGVQVGSRIAPADTADMGWKPGQFRADSSRVNLQTGDVEAYTKTLTVAERRAEKLQAMAGAMHRVTDAQGHHLRVIVLALATGAPVPADALAALQAIEAKVAGYRAKLSSIGAASDHAALDLIKL